MKTKALQKHYFFFVNTETLLTKRFHLKFHCLLLEVHYSSILFLWVFIIVVSGPFFAMDSPSLLSLEDAIITWASGHQLGFPGYQPI